MERGSFQIIAALVGAGVAILVFVLIESQLKVRLGPIIQAILFCSITLLSVIIHFWLGSFIGSRFERMRNTRRR